MPIIGCIAKAGTPRRCDDCGGRILHLYWMHTDGRASCIWCTEDSGEHANSYIYCENGSGSFLIYGEHAQTVLDTVRVVRDGGMRNDGYGFTACLIAGVEN